jgi:uncharacterized protein YbaP (TraB family)
MRTSHRIPLLVALLTAWAAAEPPARPLLWKASKGGKDGPTICLLGSLHIGRPEFYPVHPKVQAAYQAADTCVFEVDLVQAKMPWQAARLMLRGKLGGGKTLQDVISEKTWQELEACADAVGMPMAMLRPMKPWMCAQLLSAAAIIQAGYNPETGTDHHFYRLALKDQKNTVPLETFGQQLDLIQKALEPLGETVLSDTIKELNDLDKSLGELVRRWRRGDAEGLVKLLNEMELGDEKTYEVLLLNRNRKWVPKLAKLATSPLPPPKADTDTAPAPPEKPAGPRRLFVVVGAGHLVGEGSVVDLLRQQGWTVERE